MSSVSRNFSRISARSHRLSGVLLAGSLALGAVACGDDDDDGSVSPDGGSPNIDASVLDSQVPSIDSTLALPDTGTVTPPAPVDPTKGQYVLASALSLGEDTTTYIKSIEDPNTVGKIDLKNTLEAPGFGDIHVLGDKLYVTDKDGPQVKRYTIKADGTFTADQTVNFSTYTTAVNMYSMSFASVTKAYLWTETQYIAWNPTTMKIEGTIPLPTSIVARNGIKPFWGYDRAFVARGNRVYHLVSYIDYTNYHHDAGSSVVVINTDNNTVASVLEAPCPTIDAADISPNGDIYLSGWVYGPGATIVNKEAPGCILKIAAGQDVIDPSFKLVSTEFTGGHETAAFRHLTGSKYLLSVFDQDKNKFDPQTQKIDEWLNSNGWYLAVYDIATKQFQELPALGYGSGGYASVKIGDRFYILNPGSDYSATAVSQIRPDLTSTPGLTTDGWMTRLFRVK